MLYICDCVMFSFTVVFACVRYMLLGLSSHAHTLRQRVSCMRQQLLVVPSTYNILFHQRYSTLTRFTCFWQCYSWQARENNVYYIQ